MATRRNPRLRQGGVTSSGRTTGAGGGEAGEGPRLISKWVPGEQNFWAIASFPYPLRA
jgi:hypothetical protein